MDQELMTIIQNMEALLQQAKQAAGGGAEVAPEGGEEVTPDMLEKIMRGFGEKEGSPEDDKEDEKEVVVKGKIVKEDKEDEEVKKSKAKKADDEEDKDKVEKSDLGITNDDKAEERMDGANPTEEEINAVAKAFIKAYRANKSVKKSNEKEEMYKVMKTLAMELSETKKAVGNILEGLGVSEKILAPVQKSMPKNNLDEIQKSLDMIKQMSGEKEKVNNNDGTGTGSHYISKSLADSEGSLLKGIFFRNAR